MEHLNRSIETELSGSRIILEAFLQEGVKTVFGYPGSYYSYL
jgi:acetolactate synthase-1/2/3 large subunit